MSTEPSLWAKDAEAAIRCAVQRSCYDEFKSLAQIQLAIDQACADKDKELECIRANWVLKCSTLEVQLTSAQETIILGEKRIKELEKELAEFRTDMSGVIKQALDRLNAEKDRLISERDERIAQLDGQLETRTDIHTLTSLMSRIAELEAQLLCDCTCADVCQFGKTGMDKRCTLGEVAMAQRKRITEWESSAQQATERLMEHMADMAALLDRVPHQYVNNEDGRGCICLPDCPACAWALLKRGPEAQTPANPGGAEAETKSPCPPGA